MASVDGNMFSASLSSDERFQFECDVCRDDGKIREANFHCPVCSEYYCTSCEISHRRMRATRNHSILSGQDMPKAASAGRVNMSVMYCSCNQARRLVEFVCEDHHVVCCSDCEIIIHRNCKTCTIYEKCSSSTVEMDLNDIIEKSRNTEKTAKDVQYLQAEGQKNIVKMEKNCNDSIESFQRHLHAHIDMLTQTAKAELKKFVDEKAKELERQQLVSSSALQRITKDMTVLQDSKSTGDKRQMFVSVFTFSPSFVNYDKLINDLTDKCQIKTIRFQENKALKDIQSISPSLGQLIVDGQTTTTNKYGAPINILNMNVLVDQKTDITPPGVMRLAGSTFLPNGELAVCDCSAAKLILLDCSFKLKSSIKLSSAVWDVSPVNNKEVIVSLPNAKNLQFINIEPTLQQGNCIDIGEVCYGVEVVDDEIYVTITGGDKTVRIFDLKGNLKRKLGVLEDGKCMFATPYHFAVSRTSKKVFVSDWTKSEIICLSTDEQLLMKYCESDLKGPRGILLDQNDNFLVCSDDTKNSDISVFKSDSSKRHKTFLTSKEDIQDPHCISYRESDKTIIVVCTKKIIAFQLK